MCGFSDRFTAMTDPNDQYGGRERDRAFAFHLEKNFYEPLRAESRVLKNAAKSGSVLISSSERAAFRCQLGLSCPVPGMF